MSIRLPEDQGNSYIAGGTAELKVFYLPKFADVN